MYISDSLVSDLAAWCAENGVAHVRELTPAWAAQITGLPAETITAFARRYGATLYSEAYVWDAKAPDVEPFVQTAPGMELPGGLLTLDDGRWRHETPLFLPEQRALVFADGLAADSGGILRVWETPWHERRVLPALRSMLELPFELVLVSHGEPVHDRAQFEAALGRAPYSG